MEALSEQEIHQLAMDVVGEDLKEKSFEFLTVNSKPKKDPQFVCLKDKSLHFIVVKACLYPKNPIVFDAALMNQIKEHGVKFKARTYYAGVGFAHAEDYQKPLSKNAPYVVNYDGLQEIL
ncbi:Na(+)-translocating NADH-quinone reductase subunit F [Flavobacteriaceae bacterium]|nr:Na(+)-translocating NADH-quinone reductase subunit F [Flavobacteriaceae bacterium]|tara:strand:+ start:9406 stop:9765 length:360 start_codon:yes stop_codon:yes gene_type:complete